MNKIQDIVSAPFFTVISFRQKRLPTEGRLFEIHPDKMSQLLVVIIEFRPRLII